MATNQVFDGGADGHLQVTCTHPTTPASGGPCRYNHLIGVALTTEDSTSGRTTVDFTGGAVYLLSVKGVDGSGNAAVAVGDKVFYVDADTPPISKKVAGYLVGHVVEAQRDGTSYAGVTSGATATVAVRLAGTGSGIPA